MEEEAANWVYCFTIADHILQSTEGSEKCVNDAWNAMPPQRPNVLRMFLVRITRNLSGCTQRTRHNISSFLTKLNFVLHLPIIDKKLYL